MYSIKRKVLLYFSSVWLGGMLIFGVSSFLIFQQMILEIADFFPERIAIIFGEMNLKEQFIKVPTTDVILQLFIQKYQFVFLIAFLIGLCILLLALYSLDRMLVTSTFNFEKILVNDSIGYTEKMPIEFESIEKKLTAYKNDIKLLTEQNKRFQSYASHELRNELLVMRGLLMQKEITDIEILSHQTFLEDTIADLLILSYTPTQLKREHVDPLIVLAACIDALSNNEVVTLLFDETQNWQYINGKENWLYRAFFNLLQNAIKYREDNTEIIVQAIATEIAFSMSITNTYKQDEIPFATVKGHGIGLKLVEHVVKTLHGYLYKEVKNEQVIIYVSFPYV